MSIFIASVCDVMLAIWFCTPTVSSESIVALPPQPYLFIFSALEKTSETIQIKKNLDIKNCIVRSRYGHLSAALVTVSPSVSQGRQA